MIDTNKAYLAESVDQYMNFYHAHVPLEWIKCIDHAFYETLFMRQGDQKMLGFLYLKGYGTNKDVSKALDILKTIPSDDDGKYLLGLCYYELNLYEEAIKHFKLSKHANAFYYLYELTNDMTYLQKAYEKRSDLASLYQYHQLDDLELKYDALSTALYMLNKDAFLILKTMYEKLSVSEKKKSNMKVARHYEKRAGLCFFIAAILNDKEAEQYFIEETMDLRNRGQLVFQDILESFCLDKVLFYESLATLEIGKNDVDPNLVFAAIHKAILLARTEEEKSRLTLIYEKDIKSVAHEPYPDALETGQRLLSKFERDIHRYLHDVIEQAKNVSTIFKFSDYQKYLSLLNASF